MSFVTWIIFGFLVGLAANFIDPRPADGGILGAVILGILGAVVGGLLANLVFGFGISGFSLVSFAVAVLGSLFLLMLGRALKST